MLFKLQEGKTPILFLKFEELRHDPREHLFYVMRFLLCKKDLSGTYVGHRIEEVLALGHEATRSYAVKSSDGKFNAIDRFSPELQQLVKTELARYCQFFGYFKTTTNPDDKYQFFDPPVGWTPDKSLGYFKNVTQ